MAKKIAKKNVGFTPAQMKKFYTWIKENVSDKGFNAVHPLTTRSLMHAFPELGKSDEERMFYAKQIVEKYNEKMRNKEVPASKTTKKRPFKIKWLGMLSKITLNDEKYKDRVFDLNDPDDASVYVGEMYNMHDHMDLGWIENESRLNEILERVFPKIKFDSKFDGMGFYHAVGFGGSMRPPRAGRVEQMAKITAKMNAKNDPSSIKFIGKEKNVKKSGNRPKNALQVNPLKRWLVAEVDMEKGKKKQLAGTFSDEKEAAKVYERLFKDKPNVKILQWGEFKRIHVVEDREKNVLTPDQEMKGMKIINAWRSGMIEFSDERDLLLWREGLKPEDFGLKPFSSGKKSRPTPKCRKVVKKWIDGKLKMITKIDIVKFAHETAGNLRISFIDVEGSSITMRIKRDSRAKYKIDGYLKGRKIVESVPKYPQTFSFDGNALVGLWISSANVHEAPMSEYEIKSTSSGESGVATRYTIDNPRILDTIPIC